jgi:integrase
VLQAKTEAGVRGVEIHDDLQEELAAYKAARGETWQPGAPAFLNARGKRGTRNAIAQHVIRSALKEANAECARAGLPTIREQVTPHTLRYTCIASLSPPGLTRTTSPRKSATRCNDDEPHLPVRTAAPSARCDRPRQAARDTPVRRRDEPA